MSTGSDNWLYGPFEMLKTALVAVDAFRLRLGATATAAQAAAHVHYQYTDDQLADLVLQRPFAIIALPGQQIATYGVSTTGYQMQPHVHDLLLYLSDNSRHADQAASLRDFAEWAGNVMEGLCALSGSGTYIAINSVSLTGPPERTKREQRRGPAHDFWEVVWSLSCGVGQGGG